MRVFALVELPGVGVKFELGTEGDLLVDAVGPGGTFLAGRLIGMYGVVYFPLLSQTTR